MLYVAFDGSYGDSEGMVVVDNESFDEHFYNYLDDCADWNRPSFAEWFEKNDHDFTQSDNLEWACSICDEWFQVERSESQPWGLDASKGYSIYGQETGLHDSNFI